MVEGPRYSTGQTNLPYLPLYQNQNLQDTNSTYAYNCLPSSYLAADVASNGHNLTLFQGWNQKTNLPSRSDSSNEKVYNPHKTRTNQKSSQLYHAPPHPNSLIKDTDESNSQLKNEEYNKVLCSSQIPVNHKSHLYIGPSEMDCMDNGQSTLKRGIGGYNAQINCKSELSTNSNIEPSDYITRQQSDSYSPCVTPASKANTCTLKNSDSVIQSSLGDSTSKDQARKNITINKGKEGQIENKFQSKSIAECRKEAQCAILALLPYGVRYETYLKEGFKKDLLESLFKDLVIDITVPAEISQLSNSEPNILSSNALESDQSARNKSSVDKNEYSLKPISESSISKTDTKSSQMAEKERTLQSKMLALRKAREARSSAKSSAKPITEQTPENQLPIRPASPEVFRKSPTELEIPMESGKSTGTKDKPAPTIPNNITSKPTLDSSSISVQPSLSRPELNKTPSQTTTIPGLFLFSNPSETTSQQTDEILVKQRKRPVASDFDDPRSTIAPFKRPFGLSRSEQRIVIDVSDDESEDEDTPMELDSQIDQDSPVESSIKMSSNSQIRQPSSNILGRKNSTPPQNSTNYLTSNQIKQSSLAPSILKQKQREIQLMKKKIAEAEAQLKAKSETVIVGAPQLELNSPEARETRDCKDNFIISSETLQIHPHTDDKSKEQSLSQITDSMAEDSEELSKKLIDEKDLRRKKIADKLPIIESEVLLKKSRLEQLKIEISKVEAGLKSKMEEKRRMNMEMERLRQDQDAIFEMDQKSEEQPDILSGSQPVEEQRNGDSSRPPPPTEEREICLDRSSPSNLPQSQPSSPTLMELDNKSQDSSPAEITQLLKSNKDSFEVSNITVHNDDKNTTSDRHLEEVSPKVVRPNAENPDTTIRKINEHERSIDLNLNNLASDTTKALMNEAELGSGYSPELVEGSDNGSDNYEPPDATAPERMSLEISSPFSPAPPKTIEQVKDRQIQTMDPDKMGIQDDSNVAALQPNLSVIKPISDDLLITSRKKDGFTSYQSPLKIFHAYRFHPNFKKETSGGLRSMTYSHKIDASKEFCRFEIAGGICNDSACDFQHFKSIILPDDGIMAALGSPSEFAGERREKFIAGLREVLLDLRLRKVNDFDIIASEITAHRAKFLGDPSKILVLEGTVI